jgi:hypothetical protein
VKGPVKKELKQATLNFEQVPELQRNTPCHKTKRSVFDGTILRLVCDHHQDALFEASYCLKASVAHATLGAGLICYSVLSHSSDYDLGLIAHALAGLCYLFSTAAHKRAKGYYDSLHDYQTATLAASIADGIQDTALRDWTRANIALNLTPTSKLPGKPPKIIKAKTLG